MCLSCYNDVMRRSITKFVVALVVLGCVVCGGLFASADGFSGPYFKTDEFVPGGILQLLAGEVGAEGPVISGVSDSLVKASVIAYLDGDAAEFGAQPAAFSDEEIAAAAESTKLSALFQEAFGAVGLIGSDMSEAFSEAVSAVAAGNATCGQALAVAVSASMVYGFDTLRFPLLDGTSAGMMDVIAGSVDASDLDQEALMRDVMSQMTGKIAFLDVVFACLGLEGNLMSGLMDAVGAYGGLF